MRKNVKKKDHENLTVKNIEKVKLLLNPGSASDKPITKKQACDILNISYNTTRLQNIIEEYDERKEYTKKRKAGLRGRPASDGEIAEACSSFLSGDTISDISKRLFRSPSFVRSILERVGVPSRPSNKEERLTPHYFPDECVSESFQVGEVVWSAKYHAPAVVDKKHENPTYLEKYGSEAYQIYIFEKEAEELDFVSTAGKGGFYASSCAHDLGKLNHLAKLGIDLNKQL